MRPKGETIHASPTIIAALAVLVTMPALAGCLFATEDEAVQGLSAQRLTEPTGEVREFDLYASEEVMFNPVADKEVLGFAFALSPDGPWTVPGPEIRVTQGDLVRVRLHDGTGLSGHTVHWHGVSVPWAMDGVPYMTQTISPAGVDMVYTYEFVAWEAGTYWYHCHVDAPVHVDAGMFGAFIVEPADASVDPPFDREETLFFHEFDSHAFKGTEYAFGYDEPDPSDVPRNPFDALDATQTNARQTADIAAVIAHDTTGVSTIEAPPRDYYPEYSLRYRPNYDLFMINGKSFPDTEPLFTRSGETLRLRLVNAGQLVHTVHLHGHHFLVTHKDGYPLPAPYYADTLGLFPAERYDIYVEAYNPGIWDLHDHGGAWGVGGYTANDHAFPGGMNTMLVYEDFEYAALPGPAAGHTSGDYRVFAPSFKGTLPGHAHR